MYSCLDSLSPYAIQMASTLTSFAKTALMTSHTGQLYEFKDETGKTMFAKKFLSIESSGWQNEIRAYDTAQKLGIAKMLVRPRFVDLGKGKVMAVWPKLEGQTLRDYTAAGGKITPRIALGLAIARQFDEAIRNPDRNAGNVWITPHGKVKLIDQDQAFGSLGVNSHASNMTQQEAKAIWKL
jgi:hypothetical protein